MGNKILVIEDSLDSFNLVKRALGYSADLDLAPTLSKATRLLEQNHYELILLDVNLPDGDGFNFCSALQSKSETKNIPVVFLTAKNSVSDKIFGFKIGAEDFISKPFEAMELRARVESKIRKRERDRVESDFIRINGLEIVKSSQMVTAYQGDTERKIVLTQIEFKLLVMLAQKPNIVFSRDEVLDIVWGGSTFIDHRSVDTHISKLRKKLEDRADCIQSVHGSGYRFVNQLTKEQTLMHESVSAINPPPSELAIGFSS